MVIATDNFLPRWDGIARFLSEVIPRFEEYYHLTIISPDFGQNDFAIADHVKIPLRKGKFADIKFAKFRYHTIKKHVRKADIVFTQTVGPIGSLSILAAKKYKKKVYAYVHSLEAELVPMAVGPNPLRAILYPLMRMWTRYFYNKCDQLIVPSEWVADQLAWQGIHTQKVVVKLGVDTRLFAPKPDDTLRQELGIAKSDIVIGQHGRLAHEKDLRTLLRAFLRLQRHHKNVKLLIIGKGLESIADMLRKKKGVILIEGTKNVQKYLQIMDIFVISSLTETTCLSALEAMSCALPIISTPVGFVRDYINHEKNGLFFPPKDPFLLFRQLSWCVEHPTLRKRMGKAARKLVIKEFKWDKTMKDLLSIIRTDS